MSKKRIDHELDLDDDFQDFLPDESEQTKKYMTESPTPGQLRLKRGKKRTPEELEALEISKTQVKKEMLALTALGERLVNLTERNLAKIPMPEELEEGVMTARRIKSHIAKKRQLQYIGKVLRRIDVEPIQAALDDIDQGDKLQTKRHHQLEKLRDKLITEGDKAINAALSSYPDLDRQQIRQLVRQANKEREQNKPPAASRKLFKYLREATSTDE